MSQTAIPEERESLLRYGGSFFLYAGMEFNTRLTLPVCSRLLLPSRLRRRVLLRGTNMAQDLTPDENGDVRYALLVDPQAQQLLDRLRLTYGLKNWADVYDLALRITGWMTDQVARGYEVGRLRNKEFEELILPTTPDTQVWLKGDLTLSQDKPPSTTLH